MELNYVQARKEDALLLISLYNSSFLADYKRYGECPGYGKTKEQMEKSIEKTPKEIIVCSGKPVGALSVEHKGNGEYYLGCLCVIPQYQGKGIGTEAVKHILYSHSDWKKITLITPADKEENVRFYTEKCGFRAGDTEVDGNVTVVKLYRERSLEEKRP